MSALDTTAGTYARALDVATRAARAAGDILRAEFHHPGGPRGGSGHCDADAQAEAVIRDALTAAFPEYGVRGEELGRQDRPPRDAGRHCWLIDPNDGTSAFLRGHRGSAVSVALLRAGQPVLGVVYAFAAPDDAGDLIAWAEGCGPVTRDGRPVPRTWPAALTADHTVLVSQSADRASAANARLCAPARFRAVASIAYRLALVAAGEGDAACSLAGPGDWDYAAGHALLRGAGGELVDAAGQPVTYTDDGASRCGGRCFGGPLAVAVELSKRDWSQVNQAPPARDGRYGLVKPVAGKTVNDAGLLDRAAGCLIGQFAGDALGGLVEFRSRQQIAATHPDGVRVLHDGGHWNTLSGQPTDDSEMALMLARAIVSKDAFDPGEVAAAYAHWYGSHPFDMGGTTATALSAAYGAADPAAAARAAASRESQANGALMRVSPLAVFGHAADPNALAAWARADAALTHPHAACGDASAVFVVAVAHAIRTGDGPRAVYAFAKRWADEADVSPDVRQWMADAADAPPSEFQSKMGWVRIALHNAFHRLLHASTPEDGIVDTVMCGGDTDTNAAIAGAMLGAVHGARAMPGPWRDRVLTCRPIAGLANVRRPRPSDFWPADAMLLAERLLVLGRNAT